MKKITLKQNGTFQHQWIHGLHNNIPENAVDVEDDVFMTLSQDPTKKYNQENKTISDYIPPFVEQEYKDKKTRDIDDDFNLSLVPVVVNSIFWRPGIDSASRFDGAKRISELVGATSVVFTDIDKTPHTLTFAEADQVIIAVGVDYQVKFMRRQSAIKAVADLPENSTQADIDAIVY